VNARHASAVVLQRVFRGRALRLERAIFKKLEAAYLGDDTSESVHTIPQAEVAQLSETSSCGHVYGELTHEGTETVLRMMRPAHGDVLYDMGSGAGRFVVHAALALPHVRVVGV
jgi:tRNA G46 methylase TrmB